MRSALMAKLVFAAIGSYVLLCVGLFVWQRFLIYHPDTRDVSLDIGKLPGAAVMELTTQDGERLLLWYVRPRNDSSAVYLYLPGNAATLSNRAERFAVLTQQGAGLLAVSWRGYGGSSGTPTEAGLQRDAQAAYDWLATRTPPQQIIVFGESLGSGPALRLSASRPSGALVLDAAYPSLLQVAQQRLRWFPNSLLMRDTFNVEDLAPQISVPVLQRHCTQDPVLPYELAQRLFAKIGSVNKTWLRVEGDCHLPSLTGYIEQFRRLEQML